MASIVVSVLSGAAGIAYASDNIPVDAMYRLYNPYSGEHLYTSSSDEASSLSTIGWTYEGVGWYAPESSETPVYRLYNSYSGDHHYTTSPGEREHLSSIGWSDEGVGWYSDDASGVPLYRQFNPYEKIGTHNYTVSKSENDYLVSLGWSAEGVAWYGVDRERIGTVTNGTLFMGPSEHSEAEVISAFKSALASRGKSFPSDVYATRGAATAEEFVGCIFRAASAEGVRADVMYAQAMLETNYLSFGADVKPEQCNFCGLGATGNGEPGASFTTVYEGFLAQAQHLRAYSGKAPLSAQIVDPRYGTWLFGRATTVEELSGTWAMDSRYGESILSILHKI